MKLPEGFDFTQSNLQDYVDCPYRFYLRYILHTKWPALMVDDAIDFEKRGQTGARFHRLIQQYLLGVPEGRLAELAAADPNPDVATWWEDFLLNVPPWLEGEQFVETILTTHLAGHRLLAKYDLILIQGNRMIIFDWKTSQKRPRKDWLLERVQTRLYPFVLTHAGTNLTSSSSPIDPEQVRMNYWFAPHPESPVDLPYSQKAHAADQAYFRSLIEEILKRDEEDFHRTSDLNKCRFCVYRSHCDRGTQAGDLASFETFEMEPEDFELDIDFEEITEIKF